MSSFIASIVWTLPTAVRLNRRSAWFMAGGSVHTIDAMKLLIKIICLIDAAIIFM